MSDIFLSYASEDYGRIQPIVQTLERRGWSVWWDRSILAGKAFDDVIQEALDAARCVVVLWSTDSIGSHWVRSEASEGLSRRILVPVLIDNVKIPLEFRRIQAVRLIGWDGNAAEPEVSKLIQSIASLIAPLAQQEQPDKIHIIGHGPAARNKVKIINYRRLPVIVRRVGGVVLVSLFASFVYFGVPGTVDFFRNKLKSSPNSQERTTPIKPATPTYTKDNKRASGELPESTDRQEEELIQDDQTHQAFSIPCTTRPFGAASKKRSIDEICGLKGKPTKFDPAIQNIAKNNFCAAGPPVDLDFRKFRILQLVVSLRNIPFGRENLPPTRDVLRDALTLGPSPVALRSAL